jgi:hypothetical protein
MARKHRRRGFCTICCKDVAVKKDGTAQVHGRKYRVFTSDAMGYVHERVVEVQPGCCAGLGMKVRNFLA